MEMIVPWYNWRYSVDSEWNVYTTSYWIKRLLKCWITRWWYLYVNLCKNWKYKSISVHKLVADQFIPNNRNLHEINHLDWNKKNNKVSNLEWVTREQNMQHSSKILWHKPWNRKFTIEECVSIKQLYKSWANITSISKEYWISRQRLKKILTWQSYRDAPDLI